jgi:hypothetical protein
MGFNDIKGKGKGVSQQARFGPEGSRRFRLPDFHDIQYMKVVRSSASPGRLYFQECSWYSLSLGHMVQSEGNLSLKNLLTPPGIDPGIVPLVAQRLKHYTTTGPHLMILTSYVTCTNIFKFL